MELREAIGNRRSYRFLDPDRPVELEKIQRILEAARIASHFGNLNSVRALVLDRHSANKEHIDSLATNIAGYQSRQAPVMIFWYIEGTAGIGAAERIRELVRIGALGYGPKREEVVGRTLVPLFERIGPELTAHPGGYADYDLGQAVAQATLMAIEQGLGCCCQGSNDWKPIEKALGFPKTSRLCLALTLGYPLESKEAGGQRPRLPFETLYQLNAFDTPFPRSQAVVDELARAKLFQAPATLPGRMEEVEAIRVKYKLPGSGLI